MKVEKAETTANEALSLAKENKETFESFKLETTEKFELLKSENKKLKYDNDRLTYESNQVKQQSNNNENYR